MCVALSMLLTKDLHVFIFLVSLDHKEKIKNNHGCSILFSI